jgi:hypothetical protein
MRGWRSYFGFCETPEVLIYLTRWARLRVRAALRTAVENTAPSYASVWSKYPNALRDQGLL